MTMLGDIRSLKRPVTLGFYVFALAASQQFIAGSSVKNAAIPETGSVTGSGAP